jgi:hypothetical protein
MNMPDDMYLHQACNVMSSQSVEPTTTVDDVALSGVADAPPAPIEAGFGLIDASAYEAEEHPEFEVLLGTEWVKCSDEENQHLAVGLATGLDEFELKSRHQIYSIDTKSLQQVNIKTGKSRQLRRVGCSDGVPTKVSSCRSFSSVRDFGKVSSEIIAEPLDESVFLSENDRAPPIDPFSTEQPTWRWQDDRGRWNDYSLADSLEIERYYQGQLAQPVLFAARIQLSKAKAVLNFKEEIQQLQDSSGKCARIQRQEPVDDHLNNEFFYRAFCQTLVSAGVAIEKDGKDIFDFSRTQDYRSKKDDGRRMMRGGKPYRIPCGWKRFAVKVSGKYDSGSDAWLGEGEKGWAVAYHGTQKKNLPGILSLGFRAGVRQKFKGEVGKGVYCTPNINVAAYFASSQKVAGMNVQVVLQLRVRPEAIREVTNGDKWMYNQYWVLNNPQDVRAYGVLLRETPSDADFEVKPVAPPCTLM